MPREILMAIAEAFGITGKSGDGGCTPQKDQQCRERYGKYFDETCRICPEKRHGA